MDVRFDGVEPLILKFISAQCFHKANSSALLMLIDQDPSAFSCDSAQSEVELVVTIASQRMENIACRALRMNADDWRRAVYISKNQSYRGFQTFRIFFIAERHASEGQQAKVRPDRRETHIGDLLQFHRLGDLSAACIFRVKHILTLLLACHCNVSISSSHYRGARSTKLIKDMIAKACQWTGKHSVEPLHCREQYRLPRNPRFGCTGRHRHPNPQTFFQHKPRSEGAPHCCKTMVDDMEILFCQPRVYITPIATPQSQTRPTAQHFRCNFSRTKRAEQHQHGRCAGLQ